MNGSVLKLGPLDELRVSVGSQPLATVVSLLADALGTVAQGVPEPWRAAARRACPPAAARALRPACESGRLWLPDSLSPQPLDTDEVPVQLERIAALAPARLAADLMRRFPSRMPAVWQRVLDRPGPFVRGYVEAAGRIWASFTPMWRRTRHLLEVEAERVGIASVTGTLEAVLTRLGPRIGYTAEGLLLPGGHRPLAGGRPEQRLLMVPLLSGADACAVGMEGGGPAWIGYPVPGLRELTTLGKPADGRGAAPLETVLGAVRARVLRHAHHRPTMGEISALLGCAPGAVTHHCKQLEAAGLVRRRRQGQQVRLLLTRRGESLLGVLAS
ncbi:ArsR family transcriptional regulator [Streptomyces marispadix]|uniref:ArsR family transcriptional regulator n=1 Tax=Streptomyces marispadix TaxID=2922868 RepID=A0ABS9T3L7_9ACTN|nr:ArsR family transcriptional regulator [Streptomyces marispadix]MCH6163097.1 ArsR family transcriptional regulator [Streptomyces marispadix]